MATENFPIPDFYIEQNKADNKWQAASIGAFCLHAVVLIGALYLPGFFDYKPLLDEAIIIDLVSVAPLEQQTQEPVPRPKQEIPAQREEPAPEPKPQIPEEKQPEVVIPEPVEQQVEPPPTPLKPISVNPIKRKKKLASDTRLAEEKERERRAAKIKRDAEAKRQQEKRKQEQRKRVAAAMEAERARVEAQNAAEDARRQLAEMYKQQRQLSESKTKATGNTSRNSGNSQSHSIVARQYYASLYQHIHGFWVLPELRTWDKNLVATIVLVITRDGKVISSRLEQRSNDTFFDQLVSKTVQNASPMPSFPKMMKENRIEVGLRFRPGKLEM